jgi:chaperone modulatory protein CbpM
LRTPVARHRSALVVRRRTPSDGDAAEALARETGLHPELVRRLVALGFVDLAADPARPGAAALLARAMRLRRDLGLNYAGAVLAVELLDRIDQLERRLGRYEDPRYRR